MRCSVVFGVTSRLLVINISTSSPAINTAAYNQRCVITCETVAVVHRRPCWQHLVCWSANIQQALKPDMGSQSRFLPIPPAFVAMQFGTKKLEWCGYPTVKNFDDMFIRFNNSRTWQTHTRTDTAWRHRPRLCIASRGKIDFTFWLIFGLSPTLGLSETLSERLIHKVKWPIRT